MNLSALLPALLLSSGSSVSAVQPASSRWQRLGQITGPSICAMAISPAYGQDSTIWAGTPGYGLYDSTDGAGSWHAMHIPFARNGACVIAVSPTYASDHELATVTDRAYLSLDSGASWVDLGLPMTPAAIAFSPSFATDHTMLAVGDAGGIYRSIDGGAHWSNVADWQTGLPESAHFLVENLCFSPAGMVMIATGNGIYASRDSGATWAWDNAGLPLVTDHSATSLDSTPHVPAVSVSITGDAAHWRAYVAIRIQGHGSVFRSDDGTGAWTAAGGAIAALPSTLVAVAGSSQDTLLLGTDDRGLLQSNDGGTTWRSLDRGLSDRSVATILPVPGWPANPQLFLGESQDGVFQLDTLSGSWVRRFVGMPQTDAVSATAVVGTRIYAGMLSGLYRSASNGRTWSPTNTGLPGDRAVSDLAFTRGLGFVATGRGLFRSGTGARWSATGSPLMKGIAAYAVAARVVNNRVELAAGTE
ncbi:MAG: WD40/YVTN/BNR-like repeat-containing protein, partial [Chloroflexota bacterium]